MRTTSVAIAPLHMHAVVLLRDRRERLARLALVAQVRDEEAHADGALDRAHDVHAAADRPPAVARLLHELEALQPARLRERRRVAAEAAAGQLEAEQRQPVLETQQAEEPTAPGHRPLAPHERALRAPERQ